MRRSAAQLFGENTAGALAWLAGKVAADEGFSEKSVGLSLRTMTECVVEAVACVGEHSEGDAVSKATVAMEEDFPKLFQVPGDSYVRTLGVSVYQYRRHAVQGKHA